jgi:hypothetical protein
MKNKWILFLALALCLPSLLFAQAKFSTSVHATRPGKNDAYKKANGGMELITNISMSTLACGKCHSTTEKYPNGSTIDAANYTPSCNDCHDFTKGNTVDEQTCINCHNRQSYERTAYPNVDVHKLKGMTCIACHSKAELHGDDGVAYVSLKQAGAMKVKCENCHANLSTNSSHTTHAGKVDCAACHAVGVLTCAGCHFETVIATGKNRAINQIKNYRLLVKKEGEVRLGGLMSHTYAGKTNFIISSYHSHAITKNATTCTDCHANMGGTIAAINEYNTSGTMTMNKWNATTRKIEGPTGVVPIPSDWKKTLKFDFVTYTGDVNNLTSDPAKWEYLKSTIDNSHMYFADPLDDATMAKLGVTRKATSVEQIAEIPTDFNLEQNYPNPFNPSTMIRYSMPHSGWVQLKVFNLMGEEVATLVNQVQSAGSFECRFDAAGLASGMYFYRLQTEGFSETKKLLLVR